MENEPKPKSGKKKRRIVWVIFAGFFALLVILVIGAAVWYNSTLNLITRPDDTTRPLSMEELEAILGFDPNALPSETEDSYADDFHAAQENSKGENKINIMLVGQNYRSDAENKLSDTMILCTINKKEKTLTLSSIMRDMYVKLPAYQGHGIGQNRINVTYALGTAWGGQLGGMEMLSLCMYENFGVVIDNTIEINFDDFVEVIDLLGGIEIELSEDEAKYLSNDGGVEGTFSSGLTLLEGDAALSYARMRHATLSDSDFNRTERQRKVISEIIEKVRGMNLAELADLVKTVLPMVVTDMSNGDITNYLMTLAPLLLDLEIVQNQIPAPGAYSGRMVEIYGVASGVLVPDIEKNREILMEICEEEEP